MFTTNARLNLLTAQVNPENRDVLPGIAFASFERDHVPPTLAEGFEDITLVNFKV